MSKRKPWVNAMPPNEDIWLMFPTYTFPQSEHYCYWFDTQEQAVEEKKHRERMNYPDDSVPVCYIRGLRKGHKTLWLLFDLSNTNAGSHGYVWWFETREEARKHRKWQMSNSDFAPLSAPVQYKEATP